MTEYNCIYPVTHPTRFQARSKDQEIKRREVELDLQVSPEEIMSREVELGCESWTFSLRVVPQQQCNGHCLCDSVQHGS